MKPHNPVGILSIQKKQGQIVLDQVRTIDKTRLIKKLGTIDSKTQSDVVSILQRMFAVLN
jgi:mRNA interferase MazF